MSYIIFKTDGTLLTTIPDGTLNTTSTPLSIPGRLYPGYGQVTDTNFVHLLEHFANTSPPPHALEGQLWYDTTVGSQGLYICPSDGESDPNNWIKLLSVNDPSADIIARSLTLSGDLFANNAYITNKVEANLVETDYLTVNIQANIANANIPGLAEVANLNTARITTGSNTTSGSITGAWELDGSLDSLGSVSASEFKSDTYRYANGQLINFDEAAGSNTQVQYNLNGNLAGSSKLTFNDPGALLTVDGSILSINFETTGGTYAGNASGLYSIPAANIVGSLTSAVQSNITQLGTLSTLSVTNSINTSNITVSNTVTASRLTGVLNTSSQPNITSVGILTSLAVAGNANAGNIGAINGVFTSVSGSGANLSSITGANVTGKVANAIYADGAATATTAGTVTSNIQPNITTLGTLSFLTVNGNVNAPNFNGNYFGNGAGLTNLAGPNVVGSVGTANYATSANYAAYAGNIINSSQPNITTVGTLNSLQVSGNLSAGTANISGNTNFSFGTQQVRDVIEQVSINSSGITGVVNVDLIGPPTKFYTADSIANWILNFRGNSTVSTNSYLPTGKSTISTILVKQGSTPRYPTGFSIDGTAVNVFWLGGKVPTSGDPNSINEYKFNIIKTGPSSYTVFGTVSMYAESSPVPTSITRTCIAVIDECSVSASTISANWSTFRSTWPLRPFYLLQPGGPSAGSLNQPASFTADPLAYGPIPVNRDNGQPSQASDWYTICNLDELPDGSNFALWIDNSGSMTTATVQASVDLLNAKIALRGITYALQTDSGENWVLPFNKGL